MKDSDWEILYELHKNPNMTKVANLLYITQPSLTKRLQHMEAEFQVQIVERTPKGLHFTAEGELLAKKAEEYLEFLKETREKLRELKENMEGSITIGASYTYSKYALSDILVQYREKYPNISINIVNEQSNILFRKMLDDSIDVGFVRGDYEGPVNRILIGRTEGYLVTKEPVDLSMLPKMQRISYKTNDKSLELLDDWWEDRFGEKAADGMAVGYIDFAWQLIHKGIGYTICFVPENFQNEWNLCMTPLVKRDGTKVVRNTWFYYSKNKRMTRVLEDFVRFIEEEIAIKSQ